MGVSILGFGMVLVTISQYAVTANYIVSQQRNTSILSFQVYASAFLKQKHFQRYRTVSETELDAQIHKYFFSTSIF